MFSLSIKINLLRSLKKLERQPRLYLRLKNIHYFISDDIYITEEETVLNIEQNINLSEEQSQFELLLLLQNTEGPHKILGKALFDAKQWPINQEKSRIVSFSQFISAAITIKNAFFTEFESHERLSQISEIHLMESKQRQTEICTFNAFLKERNERLKEEYQQLIIQNKILQQEKLEKEEKARERNAQMQKSRKIISKSVSVLKEELQNMNLKIGAVINLINDYGRLDICNEVLDILAMKNHQSSK